MGASVHRSLGVQGSFKRQVAMPVALAQPLLLPGRCAIADRRSRGVPRAGVRGAPVRCSKEPHQDTPKRSIKELAAQQVSAAEPGGEVGRQDPGAKSLGEGAGGSTTGGGRELEVDAALKSALRPLLAAVKSRLTEREGDGEPSCGAIAAAAVAAAEGNGALPPLAGPQRAAVEGFFARLAEEMESQGGLASTDKAFDATGGSREDYFGEEEVALRIMPHAKELLEQVINWHLGAHGSPRHSSGPSDSIKYGGEVGNISLQSDTHHFAEPHGVPAESESERAERQVEAQFEQMELSDLPKARSADFEDQQEWASHPENKWASAAIEGDAPAAGGGLQAVESEAELHQLTGTNEESTAADQLNQANQQTSRDEHSEENIREQRAGQISRAKEADQASVSDKGQG